MKNNTNFTDQLNEDDLKYFDLNNEELDKRANRPANKELNGIVDEETIEATNRIHRIWELLVGEEEAKRIIASKQEVFRKQTIFNGVSHGSFRTKLTGKEGILIFDSVIRRGKYKNLTKLFEILSALVSEQNQGFKCQLMTYPRISVMIRCDDVSLLNANSEKLKQIIESALWECVGC
jgi:hypothetical protein